MRMLIEGEAHRLMVANGRKVRECFMSGVDLAKADDNFKIVGSKCNIDVFAVGKGLDAKNMV